MGCSFGKKVLGIDDVYTRYPEIEKYRTDFRKLRLSEMEVGRFYVIFKQMDKDGSGQISLEEMIFHLEIDSSPFTNRVFSIFDVDGSGEIDFKEFVIALWNYCTMGKPSLIMFAFDLYDNDSSGEIDFNEVELMLREVYGKSYDSSAHAKAIYNQLSSMTGGGFRKTLKRLKSSSSLSSDKPAATGSIDIDQFRSFVKNHPALLYPAFVLQTELQKRILGSEFWEYKASQRVSVSKGRQLNINQILSAHINEAAFNDLVERQVNNYEVSPTQDMVAVLQTTGLAHNRSNARGALSSARNAPNSERRSVPNSGRQAPNSARSNDDDDKEQNDSDGHHEGARTRKQRLNQKAVDLREQKRKSREN